LLATARRSYGTMSPRHGGHNGGGSKLVDYAARDIPDAEYGSDDYDDDDDEEDDGGSVSSGAHWNATPVSPQQSAAKGKGSRGSSLPPTFALAGRAFACCQFPRRHATAAALAVSSRGAQSTAIAIADCVLSICWTLASLSALVVLLPALAAPLHSLRRCTRCAAALAAPLRSLHRCARCTAALAAPHACAHCAGFFREQAEARGLSLDLRHLEAPDHHPAAAVSQLQAQYHATCSPKKAPRPVERPKTSRRCSTPAAQGGLHRGGCTTADCTGTGPRGGRVGGRTYTGAWVHRCTRVRVGRRVGGWVGGWVGRRAGGRGWVASG
jgi:hypothetical protein